MHEEQKDVKCGVDLWQQPPRLTLTFVAILLKVSCIPACRTSQSQKRIEAFKGLLFFSYCSTGGSSILLIAYSDFYTAGIRCSLAPGGTGIHSLKHVAFFVFLDLYYSTLKLSQDEAWEMVGGKQ